MALVKVKTRRLKGVTKNKPFVYGSTAFFLGKGSDTQHSHRWTVYVRGLNFEDLSTFIKKVEFKLHETFVESLRILTQPPFEVTETGWGEFTVGIKIYFYDARADPIQLSHHLKLFPDNGAAPSTKKPVVFEKYDEFVFVDPLETFANKLDLKPTRFFNDSELKPYLSNDQHVSQEQSHLTHLKNASAAVKRKTDDLRRRLYSAVTEIEVLRKRKRAKGIKSPK